MDGWIWFHDVGEHGVYGASIGYGRQRDRQSEEKFRKEKRKKKGGRKWSAVSVHIMLTLFASSLDGLVRPPSR